MQVLVYAQHLSGIGSFVRSREIARELAREHDVFFVQGGRPVPGRPIDGRFEWLPIPVIERRQQDLVPFVDHRSIDELMAVRGDLLEAAVWRIAPDVLLVEHFPFSKWELRDEILPLIRSVRSANPAVRVWCSLRDISPQSRFESFGSGNSAAQVSSDLNEHFDGLLVHGDPGISRLDDFFSAVDRIAIPMHYTGIVAEKREKRTERSGALRDLLEKRSGIAVWSSGGGRRSVGITLRIVRAWRAVSSRGEVGDRVLVLFSGLDWSDEEVLRVEIEIADGPFRQRPFSADFLDWLELADLSISHAGYSTSANLLELGTRALLIPDPVMSDQTIRARRLAERGAVEIFEADEEDSRALEDAILRALGRPRVDSGIALDGARATREILEAAAGLRE